MKRWTVQLIEVRRGGEVVQKVSGELSQIIQQVQTLAPSFETVSEGNRSIGRLDDELVFYALNEGLA